MLASKLIVRQIDRRDKPALAAVFNEFRDTLAPGVGVLTADPFFANPRNVGFMTTDGGGFVLFNHLGMKGMYEVHLICRHKATRPIELGRAAMAFMFTYRGAVAISTLIPKANRASRVAARAIGGTPIGDSTDNLGRPCTAYVLERKAWVRFSERSRA